MKAVLLLASVLWLASCHDTGQHDRERAVERTRRAFYRQPPGAALADELTRYVARNQLHNSPDEIVYVALDTLPNRRVTALIGTSVYLSEIKKVLPAYFTRLNGDLVLLYPRKQPSYRDSTARWAFFRQLTHARLIDDVGPDGKTRYDVQPVSFDPEVRLVEIVRDRVVHSAVRRDH